MLLPLSRVALLLATLLASCRADNVTTQEPTTPSESTPALTTTTQEKQENVTVTTPETPSTTTKITADAVLEEVSHLLEKLREVAASMREAREEHERLADAVAQVTAAVKDMGEHNLHIKKKVRKMSKGLKKNSHNKKIKDGIKSLQRDHQRILHAMSLSGINITRLHNHTRKHNLTHPRPSNHKNQHGRNRKNHNNNNNNNNNNNHAATTTATPVPENATKSRDQKALEEEVEGDVVKEGLTEKKDDGDGAVAGSTDNLIPELVVDPPSSTDPPLPADCLEVMQRGNWTSGVYFVQPQGLQPHKVWCDHTTNGGGWTVLLARLEQDNQEDFDKGWAEYKKGIGDPAAEHWLGLDALHVMTKARNHELRVNITDWNNSTTWAEWKEFRVAGENEKYKLTVGRYTSDSHAGDALKWHNGMKFSTPDRDNDVLLGGHCAKKNDGGWWYRGYRGCYQAHPTGRYQHNPGDPPKTSVTSRNFELGPVLVWQNWRGESYYPKTLFLMFRPALN